MLYEVNLIKKNEYFWNIVYIFQNNVKLQFRVKISVQLEKYEFIF